MQQSCSTAPAGPTATRLFQVLACPPAQHHHLLEAVQARHLQGSNVSRVPARTGDHKTMAAGVSNVARQCAGITAWALDSGGMRADSSTGPGCRVAAQDPQTVAAVACMQTANQSRVAELGTSNIEKAAHLLPMR